MRNSLFFAIPQWQSLAMVPFRRKRRPKSLEKAALG
jgi:hypothetical protein